MRQFQHRGKLKIGVKIVSLRPPNQWHLDSFGEFDDYTGDYLLSSLGPKRTKLNMTFVKNWRNQKPMSKSEYVDDVNRLWNKYTTALENDYRNHRPPK